VRAIRAQRPSLKYCAGHRKYANKACPGRNITDAFIKEVFDSSVKPQDTSVAKKHLENALLEIQEAINNL